MNQPAQPSRLAIPELNYPYAAGLSRYDTAMLKLWVGLITEIAMEKMREEIHD